MNDPTEKPRHWPVRAWHFVRRDWPTTAVFVIAVVLAANQAQQFRNVRDIHRLIDVHQNEDIRGFDQSCQDRNDSRQILSNVLAGLIADPSQSDAGRARLRAQLAKITPIDCAAIKKAMQAGTDPAKATGSNPTVP